MFDKQKFGKKDVIWQIYKSKKNSRKNVNTMTNRSISMI